SPPARTPASSSPDCPRPPAGGSMCSCSYRQDDGSEDPPWKIAQSRTSAVTGVARMSVRFFFFQAEDGIRDFHVTGVQTCALPICKYSGQRMTIREGMARSINSIAAFLIKKIGPSMVVDYAKRLGIESHLEPVPALSLGTSDVPIFDLVGAYSTFVNEGVYTRPYFITRIEHKNGNVLQEFPPRTREALSEETAYLMLHMLKGTTEWFGEDHDRFGTAVGLGRYGLLTDGNEVGGKTGTTANYSDGWFVGVTKDLVAGVWVGGEDRSIHFRTLALGQGG